MIIWLLVFIGSFLYNMIKKVGFVVFTILLMLFLYFSFGLVNNDRVEVSLLECIDGDTAKFLLSGKVIKVRFLGIDAPEISNLEYGNMALDYTCDKLKSARNIYLEYDKNSDRYDKYNRVLAWVFVDDDNLNELLVKNGYAMVRYVYDDYLYVDNLCMAQEEAFQDKLGIWNVNDYSSNYCNKKK